MYLIINKKYFLNYRFSTFCTPEETRTPILRFRRPSCFIAPRRHLYVDGRRFELLSLDSESNILVQLYYPSIFCGTYGFEPPVIGPFSLFHPVSIHTQLF